MADIPVHHRSIVDDGTVQGPMWPPGWAKGSSSAVSLPFWPSGSTTRWSSLHWVHCDAQNSPPALRRQVHAPEEPESRSCTAPGGATARWPWRAYFSIHGPIRYRQSDAHIVAGLERGVRAIHGCEYPRAQIVQDAAVRHGVARQRPLSSAQFPAGGSTSDARQSALELRPNSTP